MTRGELRIYFGVAPGVGKTYAMLNEGRRRAERGTDVVIAYYEDHGRSATNEQLEGLSRVPRHDLTYRDRTISEMDIDAVLVRKPALALVDELAHTNATGSRNAKRWQDVEEMLEAGIDVISTLNVQHVESLVDVVERVTEVKQRETVPDVFLRAADQIELVDMSPEALRRRMAHGNIYPAEKVDAALANYFREVNLNALRELALLWVADQVDDKLQEYRERHDISEVWDTREKVVVALSSAPGEEQVIRRAARAAMRNKAELIGLHVRTDDGLRGRSDEHMKRYIELLEEFGGIFREVVGNRLAPALVNAARVENATQLFIGETDRSRWSAFWHGSTVGGVVHLSGAGLDVHVISTQSTEAMHERRSRAAKWLNLAPISLRRRVSAWAIVVLGLPLLAVVTVQDRRDVGLQTAVPIFLIFAVVVGAVGGVWPAFVGALSAFAVLDYFFAPPFHTLTIASSDDAFTLAAFVVVAGIVSVLVDLSSRSSRDARLAQSEARGLARMATSMLGRGDPLAGVLDDLVSTFRLDGAALMVPTASGWTAEATAGSSPPQAPVDGDDTVTIGLPGGSQLVVHGSQLSQEDEVTLRTFGGQIGVAMETRRLQAEAAEATTAAQSNELRAALLSAVSHDLRTPLSTIKAGISGLLADGATWSTDDARAVLASIDTESDRLNAMVANLLDMSRIRSGVLVPKWSAVSVDEIVVEVLDAVSSKPGRIELHIDDDIRDVNVDSALLVRSLVNVLDNGLKYSPETEHVHLSAAQLGENVVFRVVDRGPGVPEEDRERVFVPFQRLDDAPEGKGVGLGLAIAKGFVEAMDGSIEIDATPSGGSSVSVSVPAA